jgi:hypothetical protein
MLHQTKPEAKMSTIRLLSITSGLAMSAGFTLLLNSPQEVYAAPLGQTPAVSCRAASLDLAKNLRWDHIRVWNQATFPVWVVCPVINNTEWWTDSEDTLHWQAPSAGTVYAWFDSTAAATAQVKCTWLDLDPNVTGTSAIGVTHTIKDPASLPGVKSQVFDLAPFNGLYPQTITCKLDPSTGLNTYTVTYGRDLLSD